MSRVHVRPKSQRSPAFNLSCVQAVLDAFEHKSVWNGKTDDLTIVRIDHSKPLDIGNAMVLQVREANSKVPETVVTKAKEIAEAMLSMFFAEELQIE